MFVTLNIQFAGINSDPCFVSYTSGGTGSFMTLLFSLRFSNKLEDVKVCETDSLKH